jgi:tetratricopeptide (TPR) repeat protein
MRNANASNEVQRTDDVSISQARARVAAAPDGTARLRYSQGVRPSSRPPLLPVLIGVCAIGFGLINGLVFSISSVALLLGRPAEGPPVTIVEAMLALTDLFCLLQIPAGVGILLHRSWGRQLAEATALGALISGGVGMLPMFLSPSPDVVAVICLWGFLTGLVWAVVLKVAFRFRSMRDAFGGQPLEPPAKVLITCPNCGKSGSLKSQLPPGAKVRCKGCNRNFEPTIDMQVTECWELNVGPCEDLIPPVLPTAPRQVQPASVPPTKSSNPADLSNAILNSAKELGGRARAYARSDEAKELADRALGKVKQASSCAKEHATDLTRRARDAAVATMPFWQRLFREIREIVGATARQTARLIGYGYGIARTHVLIRKARSAQLALGNRMYEAGVGDEAIRGQIASLDDRIASVELGKGSTEQMEAEKKGLMIRLAADALAQDVAPMGAADEHGSAVSARNVVEAHRSRLVSARAGLAPQDTTSWRRIGLGYGVVMLALAFATTLFLRSANKPSEVSRPFRTDTTPTFVADADDHLEGVIQKKVHPGEALSNGIDQGVGGGVTPTTTTTTGTENRTGSTTAAAQSNRGNALLNSGDLPGAIAAYREAIRLQPDLAEAHSNLGIALYNSGDVTGAIAAYREAIRLRPYDAATQSILGIALSHSGDLPGAIAAYHEAIRLQPDDAVAQCLLGRALSRSGDLPGAIAAYREAIRLQPDDAGAHSLLGSALLGSGDLPGAIAACREAIRLRPDRAESHHDLGAVLMDSGDVTGAIAEFREAIRLRPDDARAHCFLGLGLGSRGEYAESLAELRTGHELGSKRPDWRYPSADWVRQAEQMLARAGRMPTVPKVGMR